MLNEDFVSRQWLIDEYHRRHKGPPGGALKMIEEAPAADVEPVKHGYWVYKMRERNKCEFVSGFDHLGDWHTITVITHVKGPVPYCGLCGALAADSFLDYCSRCGAKMDAEPPKEETVNEITPEMIEAAERNEKRIKERVDKLYDELIAEKRAEIERLEAEIAKMPPFDAEKLAAIPIVPPKEFII